MSAPVSDLPQAQVDAIIRTKRKAREPKACYPCHTRKVKCDRNLPCDGCVKRDHADLCSYERPSKKRQAVPQNPLESNEGESSNVGIECRELQSAIGGTSKVLVPRYEWESVCAKLKDMEHTISSLRTSMEQADPAQSVTPDLPSRAARSRSDEIFPEREGIHAPKELGDGTVHFGSRSILAYILRRSTASQETAQALLEGAILPKLGLDNETATYPFVDLWSSDRSAFDVNAVCATLPDDNQCRMFINFYRDICATLYPVIPDLRHFESSVDTLLGNRALSVNAKINKGESMDKPFGMTMAFIGLFFAVLAAGCQSSDLAAKERELTSRVYVCCSYQCLRMTNFLSQPTIEATQTLLIIGNVLSYNMNPGVSYVLLGMTTRMGLALGLHVESHRFSPAEKYIRRKVWWSMAWQDSHFSLSYDRPSTMAFSHPDIPYRPNSQPGDRSYFETLCRVILLTLGILRGRMLSPHSQMSFNAIQAYKDEIQRILADAAPHLCDQKYCISSIDNLERVSLKLHSSYISSELCRPALKSSTEVNDPATVNMRRDCVAALVKTVEAYVELHSISSHASRSWIGLQRAISCAFLLAVISESKTDPQIWHLLRQLEGVIAERASTEGAFDQTSFDQSTTTGTTSSSIPTITSPQSLGSSNPPVGAEGPPNVINGVTNIPLSTLDQVAISAVPASVAADTQTQWAKPLTKTLRALQKLNAVFSTMHHKQSAMGGILGAPGAHGLAPGVSSFPPLGSPSAAAVKRSGSLPPPTPDSSTSSEWTLPSLMDRAAEYIHPPLWA